MIEIAIFELSEEIMVNRGAIRSLKKGYIRLESLVGLVGNGDIRTDSFLPWKSWLVKLGTAVS